MIRFLSAQALGRYPRLAAGMHEDRARQFHGRLGWAVSVDGRGQEHDIYDRAGAHYVIWQTRAGCHGGSLRFLPSVGPHMLRDHFAGLAGGPVRDPLIWETTRFCLAPGAGPRVSAALMLGAAQLGLGLGLRQAIGVFDRRMTGVYRRLGWSPQILGCRGEGRAAICAGVWRFETSRVFALARRAGLRGELAAHWFRRDFAAR